MPLSDLEDKLGREDIENYRQRIIDTAVEVLDRMGIEHYFDGSKYFGWSEKPVIYIKYFCPDHNFDYLLHVFNSLGYSIEDNMVLGGIGRANSITKDIKMKDIVILYRMEDLSYFHTDKERHEIVSTYLDENPDMRHWGKMLYGMHKLGEIIGMYINYMEMLKSKPKINNHMTAGSAT